MNVQVNRWLSSMGLPAILMLVGLVISLSGCKKAENPGKKPNATATAANTVSGATGATNADGPALSGQGRLYKVALYFTPAHPKVSQLFSVRTVITKLDGSPAKVDTLAVDATMPAHGHGMMTRPVHNASPDGSWQTKGMKLHMHGKWVFEVDVRAGKKTDRITLPYEQPPEAL